MAQLSAHGVSPLGRILTPLHKGQADNLGALSLIKRQVIGRKLNHFRSIRATCYRSLCGRLFPRRKLVLLIVCDEVRHFCGSLAVVCIVLYSASTDFAYPLCKVEGGCKLKRVEYRTESLICSRSVVGKQNEVVKAELAGSVFHLDAEQWKNIIIAYEPIWAIGTGKTATAEQAEEIHAYIRSCVAEVFGAEVADDTTILYGGSCKASNAPELFAKPDIDGGLIGGASLKAPDFKGIIDAWN